MLTYIDIFREFNKKKIKYIVVGGLAVNLHGIPRMTYDTDLLLDLEDSNIKKFILLMQKWGFKPKAPVKIADFANGKTRRAWIKEKNMKAFNLTNPNWPLSEIDVIINTPIDYKKARKSTMYVKIQNVTLPLISLRDLIKMKEGTGREQDKRDRIYLKRILNEER